jgi:hypothetical protein
MLANDGRKLQSVRLPGKADVEKDQIKWRVLTDNRLSGRAIVRSPNRVVRIPFEGCSRQREQCRIVIHHENALGHVLHLVIYVNLETNWRISQHSRISNTGQPSSESDDAAEVLFDWDRF